MHNGGGSRRKSQQCVCVLLAVADVILLCLAVRAADATSAKDTNRFRL